MSTTQQQTTSTGNIAQNALLANLKVTTWTARKFDKAISTALNTQYNATRDVSRVTKKLVPDSFKSYDLVVKTAGHLRTYHYKHTTPWIDRGARILPAANYLTYTAEMSKLKSAFDNAVVEFVKDYPQLLQDAPTLMGNLYRASDFPSTNSIARLFAVELVFIPFADVQDIRCNLGNAVAIAELQQQTEDRFREALNAATNDLASRLSNQVAKIAEYGKRGKDRLPKQTIEGLRELCALIPSLNLTGDQNLQGFVDRAMQELDRPDQTPEDAADKAQHIVDDLAAFMGNNGTPDDDEEDEGDPDTN